MKTPEPKPAANRLAGLEALRGIAALSVMLLHIPAIFAGLPKPFGKGYLGVDLFFILSGFVMVRGFEQKVAGRPGPLKFFLGRYRRMWPVMAVGGLIGLPLLYMRMPDFGHFAIVAGANLLLLPTPFGGEAYPLNVPAWTIFFILLGNLLHVLVLHRLHGALLAFAIAASLAVLLAVAIPAGSLDVGAQSRNFLLGVPRLLLGYLIGMALGRWWAVVPPPPVSPALALAAMPLLCVAAWWLGITGWLFDILFVTIACPLMIAGAMRLRSGGRITAFIGAWSFPLYAVHFPLLIWMRMWGYPWYLAAAAALAVSWLVTLAEIQLRAAPKKVEKITLV
jgi:peptidoglycan/LPS O-acetylase OafA/YrhL